jgi:UDP:flavonoid glycosyltransferase YjiC (YdhE family)
MGGNLGHVARDLPLAIACRAAGHEVLFAAKDLGVCVDAARAFGIGFVQAPVLRFKPTPGGAINHADLLWQTGFSDAAALESVLLGWRGLFDTFKPDAMVYDFAPRALLAARLASIPVLLLGSGFEIPPRVSPLPSFQPGQAVPTQQLLDAEARVVARINGILTVDNKPVIDQLWQLYAPSPALITNVPELDHFGARPEAQYVGMASRLPTPGHTVHWESQRKKILVYLRAESEGAENVFAALREIEAEVICCVPHLPQAWRARYGTVRFFEQPLDLDALLAHADMAITHGSITAARAVLAGVPVLLLPGVMEQYLTGLRIEQQGFGRMLRRNRSVENCLGAMQELLFDDRFHVANGRLVERYGNISQHECILKQCLALNALMSLRQL